MNCAAWTDVDGAEDEPDGALAVNGTGAGIVAEAAAAVDAKVLYVSSDYVFDGKKTEPYVESDPTGPISAYGTSKLAGEIATLNANRRSFVVRSSWLLAVSFPSFVSSSAASSSPAYSIGEVPENERSPLWHHNRHHLRFSPSESPCHTLR